MRHGEFTGKNPVLNLFMFIQSDTGQNNDIILVIALCRDSWSCRLDSLIYCFVLNNYKHRILEKGKTSRKLSKFLKNMVGEEGELKSITDV